MAQPLTFNPYSSLGARMDPGLAAIIAGLPSPATVTPDNLVDEVFNFISSVYYPTPSTQVEEQIKSISYHVINSVRNSLVLSNNAVFMPNQMPFIEMLIGNSMTSNLPAVSFKDRVADIEDNIGTSDLNVSEQIPLFLATTTGSNAYTYWLAELANPTSAWLPYFSTNNGENYANTIYWGMEAMNGALAAYGATPQGLISPTTDVVSVDMISALIGALTATAGKVIFKWIPRITKPLSLNVSAVVNLGPVVGEPQMLFTSIWNCKSKRKACNPKDGTKDDRVEKLSDTPESCGGCP